jgi:lycopene cyclase domain-containing protein
VDEWRYLIVLGCCVLITVPLELAGARVYRRPRRWLVALAPIVAVLLVWDVAAIAAGVWDYNPAYLIGVTLPFGVPVEELLFFLVVPTCGLLTYEAVELMLGRLRNLRRPTVREQQR